MSPSARTGEEQLFQNLAAESDPRTTAIDYQWWEVIVGNKARPEEGSAWGEWIDVTFVICPLCDGRGKHVNPSIDAHGLTSEDFDEDPDFRESYFRGDYDVRCTLCRGERVIPVPVDPAIRAEIEEEARYAAEARAEMLAEMRMGA